MNSILAGGILVTGKVVASRIAGFGKEADQSGPWGTMVGSLPVRLRPAVPLPVIFRPDLS